MSRYWPEQPRLAAVGLNMLRPSYELGVSQLGGPTTIQPTTDVSEWMTYFGPVDDIHGILMDELEAATDWAADPVKIPEIHSSQYAFTDADVAREFAVLAGNPRSRFLFDQSQAGGAYEDPVLKVLLKEIPRPQWAIGWSPIHHAILHTKAIAILYANGDGFTMTGSFNLTRSAEEQFNIVDMVRSRSRAELFANQIDSMFNWVRRHEEVQRA
jgi:hypothetical protein